jgi:lipoic acid synthetase
MPSKPDWIRVRIQASLKISEIKQKLCKHGLHTVFEEANCPNLGESFGGKVTFMIIGDIFTRHCP